MAQKIMQKLTNLKEKLKKYTDLASGFEDVEVLYELSEQEDESLGEVTEELKQVKESLEVLELETLLNSKYDRNDAIITLHPGAGGTESQDWTEMLYRMYTRWAEKEGYRVQIFDLLPGDEAGIKSVTLSIQGENAFGYLKAEKGVHRLVRISPFDSSGRRHTSFAALEVMPEVNDEGEIEIDTKDLKIDTFRAGGAGGQHVNTTDSAVRITHLPTGIVTQCQNERSQISNRHSAMKILQAKLLEKKLKDHEKELAQIKGDQQEIGWGSQIRSYVFHPYNMVKDHRTNVEKGNVQAVMDGDINEFIYGYLKMQARKEN
ncbi:bacterial peptide chain release factor 2 (bRF-2) [Desulfonispora thiosulfatigenes DSM 11270]|uniref:Peptide chain release factor 2 n=2 Tax=Desulfonispora thiosulfatigenes TaxID=83661 RepID=A0A1W1UX60_DESTI|nr:bacterial peptide chain release factor 2 (bRF-2) [Desulfonispora thiosulfatigenes DSM 11270]